MTNKTSEQVVAEALTHWVPSGDANCRRLARTDNIIRALREAGMLREPSREPKVVEVGNGGGCTVNFTVDGTFEEHVEGCGHVSVERRGRNE